MSRLFVMLLVFGCLAAASPVSARPCDTAADCLPGQECYYPIIQDCSAPAEGFCVQSIPPCNADSGLVCGCDGRTYVSECEAEGETSIDFVGACQVGNSCGGQTCVGNNFCQLPLGECSRYAPDGCKTGPAALLELQYETDGVCVPYPTSCSQVSDPVCACTDGDLFLIGGTYLNACYATQAFRSIAHEGACGGSGCGGFAGWSCTEPGDVCVENCQVCGFDISGRCEPATTECQDYCAPVCDCGGGWHKNRCEWKLGWPAPSYPLTLRRPAGCDEIYNLRFMSKSDILAYGWSSLNVYRATLTATGQPGPWNCVESGVTWWPYSMAETPPPGEVWAIGMTTVFEGVEGSLGWGGAGCTERTITNPCPP